MAYEPDPTRKIDALNSTLVLILLIAGAIAFTVGAMDTGIAGLPQVVAGGGLWTIAYHLKQLGRLY